MLAGERSAGPHHRHRFLLEFANKCREASSVLLRRAQMPGESRHREVDLAAPWAPDELFLHESLADERRAADTSIAGLPRRLRCRVRALSQPRQRHEISLLGI